MAIIEFPNSREDYIRLGQEHLAQKKIQPALDFFQAAYELEADFSLNLLLTSLLKEQGEHQRALHLAGDFLADYLTESRYFVEYVQLLLLNQQFLTAREYLLRFKDAADEAWYTQLSEQIEQLEAFMSQLEKQKLNELSARLKHIGDDSLTEQTRLVEELKRTPIHFFLTAAEDILKNSSVNYFTRLKVLEKLIQLQIAKPVSLRWFNQALKSLQPNQLSLPERRQSLKDAQKLITEQLEHQQPDLLVPLLEEIQLHLLLLFPFEEAAMEKVGGVINFAKSYLLEYAPESFSDQLTVTHEAEIDNLKQELRQFIWQLMGQ